MRRLFRSCMLPTERRRIDSRSSQRIISGLAENTNSIFRENLPRPETANGCLVLPSAGTYAESHPVRIDRSEIGLPLATRGPSWQGAWSGHVLDCAPFSPLVARWVRSRGAARHAYKNPDGVNRSVTSGQLRESASKLLDGVFAVPARWRRW